MTRIEDAILRAAATRVLRRNDRGRVVVAAEPDPRRHHRWHWEATLTALGLARVDLPRAITEVRALLAAQRPTGMLPLSIFDEGRATGPGPVQAVGLSSLPGQPIAVRAILDRGRDNGGADLAAAEEFVAESFDALLASHRWFVTERDPERTGLIEILHPWESAFPASPRWDGPLSRSGPHPRATREERERWLLEQMRAVGWADTAMREVADFRVRDVIVSAVVATCADLLAGLADEVGRTDVTEELKEDAARFREGVAATVDPRTMLARDFDVRAGVWIEPATVAGFAPLLAGGDAELLAAQRAILLGEDWMGHPVLRHPLPPMVSPSSPGFRRRELWHGPIWPPVVVMLAWAATRDGAWDLRAVLRDAMLELLSDHSFAEFYEPITGEPLGVHDHSWTAATALELLG
ncbi:MGH1-like glycoside hydrolase domain-containing protein [Pseudonocardia sp. CA-107938]|uniref:MGH1-like glycoside hydrolase domain-containing protein n=1 Tax=Pseudonocardia sp. CA-107938 TaxID=3240021 RepID=UPI003D8C9CE0